MVQEVLEIYIARRTRFYSKTKLMLLLLPIFNDNVMLRRLW